MNAGDIFHSWTVVDETTAKKSNGYSILCRCICGTEKSVSAKYLRSGKSKSCGCYGVFAGMRVDDYVIISLHEPSGSTRNRFADYLCVKCGATIHKRVEGGGNPRSHCDCRVDRGEKHRTHGESPQHIRTREYNCWRQLRQRCLDPNNKAYRYYGGRGITVCERWSSYENFIIDMGRCPDGHSIDRIDTNGNYEPGNCRWATDKTQNRNRTTSITLTFGGVTKSLCDWADEAGLSRSTLYQRYKKHGDNGSAELMLAPSRAAKR